MTQYDDVRTLRTTIDGLQEVFCLSFSVCDRVQGKDVFLMSQRKLFSEVKAGALHVRDNVMLPSGADLVTSSWCVGYTDMIPESPSETCRESTVVR